MFEKVRSIILEIAARKHNYVDIKIKALCQVVLQTQGNWF